MYVPATSEMLPLLKKSLCGDLGEHFSLLFTVTFYERVW